MDSIRTDSAGKYELVLYIGSYGVLTSAVGFKDSVGNPVKLLSAKVAQDSTTYLDVNLTPATCRISGSILQTNPSPNAPTPIMGAHARVIGPFGRIDSAFTDATGAYVFMNMIAGVYRFDFYANGRIVSMNSVRNLGAGEATVVNVNFPSASTGIQNLSDSDDMTAFQFSNRGDKLVLRLTARDVARTLEIFTVDGSLHHGIFIPPRESRLIIPGIYAPEKGFRFRLK